MSLWFVVDPLEKLKLGRDSTLFWISLLKDIELFWVHSMDTTGVRAQRVRVNYSQYDFQKSPEILFDKEFYSTWKDIKGTLVLRLDPPVDALYRGKMSLLATAGSHVRIVNSPMTLGALSEKHIPLVGGDEIPFTNLGPSKDNQIIKDLWGYGGHSVRKSRGSEILGDSEIAQDFDSLISHGEHRVYIIGSSIIGTLVKLPSENDFRSNLQWGAQMKWVEISEHQKQRTIFYQKWLADRGVTMATVDFIGNRIIEINITCPGLLYPIALLEGFDKKNWSTVTDALINYSHQIAAQ